MVTWIRPSTGRFSRHTIQRLMSAEARGESFSTGSDFTDGVERQMIVDVGVRSKPEELLDQKWNSLSIWRLGLCVALVSVSTVRPF